MTTPNPNLARVTTIRNTAQEIVGLANTMLGETDPGAPLGVPANLAATVAGGNDVTLTWASVPGESVMYDVANGAGNVLAQTASLVLTQFDLAAGTHTFKVRAVDGTRVSTYSSTITVVIQAATPTLPSPGQLTGTVSSTRVLTLNWPGDPAYPSYEVHESTADPANTLKATVTTNSRVSGQLAVRTTPLRYGVRGKTADGSLGPWSNAVTVLINENGGTVTVSSEPFAVPDDPGNPDDPPPPPPPPPGGGTGGTAVMPTAFPDGTAFNFPTGGSALAYAATITGATNRTISNVTVPSGGLRLVNCDNVIVDVGTMNFQQEGDIIQIDNCNRVMLRNMDLGPEARPSGTWSGASCQYVYVDGTSKHIYFDRCRVKYKNSSGNGIKVYGVFDVPGGKGGCEYVLYRYCEFEDIGPFDENDHEPLRHGVSTMLFTDTNSMAMLTRWARCQSEPEPASIKMCKFWIWGCTFEDCVGGPTLRHGNFSKILHSHMKGNIEVTSPSAAVRCTGGGRFYGQGHEYAWNTVEVMVNKLTRNYERPLLLDTGDASPTAESNGHANVVAADVHHNLFVKCGNGGGPIYIGDNYGTAPTGQIHDNMCVATPSPGANGITAIGGTSMAGLTVTNQQIYATEAEAGVTRGSAGEARHASYGSKVPYLTADMVGPGSTWVYVQGTGGGDEDPPPPPPPPDPPGTATYPADLLQTRWKLTTTLQGSGSMPLEVFRDARTGPDFDTYVHENWKLNTAKDGIDIICPASGFTTPNSSNKRWELRMMNADASDEQEFDLAAGAPILDVEVAVHAFEGNHIVLAQIHGQDEGGDNDDLTVFRAEPNSNGTTYTLWITDGDTTHGHQVANNLAFGQKIAIGFRPAADKVRYVFQGAQLAYEMNASYSTVNYYKAGNYNQVKGASSSKTRITLYKAQIG